MAEWNLNWNILKEKMHFLNIYKDNDRHMQVATYLQYYLHSRSEHLYALKKSMVHHGTIIRAGVT